MVLSSLHKIGRPPKPASAFIPQGRMRYESNLKLPDGKQWRRSMKTTDELLAKVTAEEMQNVINCASRIAPDADIFDFALHHINSVFIKMGRTPINMSYARLSSDKSVANLLDEYLESKGKLARRSEQAYRSYKKALLEIMGDLASGNISDITPVTAQRILDEYANGKGGRKAMAKRSKQTVLGMRKFCSAVYAHAIKAGWTSKNPFKDLEIDDTESLERLPFTEDEVSRLTSVANDEWRLINTLASVTGMRIGDAKLCGSKFFKRIDGRLFLQWIPEKSRRKKCVTIPVVEPLLSLVKDKTEDEFLFPRLARKQSGSRSGLSFEFRKIMDEAKVEYDIVTLPSGREATSKSFHSWRHTLATRLTDLNVPQKTIMALTGHSSKRVNDGYIHDDMEKALDQLNK